LSYFGVGGQVATYDSNTGSFSVLSRPELKERLGSDADTMIKLALDNPTGNVLADTGSQMPVVAKRDLTVENEGTVVNVGGQRMTATPEIAAGNQQVYIGDDGKEYVINPNSFSAEKR